MTLLQELSRDAAALPASGVLAEFLEKQARGITDDDDEETAARAAGDDDDEDDSGDAPADGGEAGVALATDDDAT